MYELQCVCVFIVVYSFQLLNESLCSSATVDSPSCEVIRWKMSTNVRLMQGYFSKHTKYLVIFFSVHVLFRQSLYNISDLPLLFPSVWLCLTQRITRLLHSTATNKFPIPCVRGSLIWQRQNKLRLKNCRLMSLQPLIIVHKFSNGLSKYRLFMRAKSARRNDKVRSQNHRLLFYYSSQTVTISVHY